MQPPPTWSSNSSGGGEGGGAGRGGLSRFRSAPATWLEELLEGEEEDPLKSNHSLTQLLVGSTPPSSRSLVVPLSTAAAAAAASSSCSSHGPGFLEPGGRFQRQNSSPADFLGSSRLGSDGYFSSFGISNNYELISSDIDVSPKRVSFSLEGERSRQVDGAESGLMDMEVEKLLEDSVPCRVRAKRGCATHPRSIAERVRRTRISDRIRKLQELVPNMDKQTNTADMLDEAVEYVKFLQKQIQELLEHQSKCTCVSKE